MFIHERAPVRATPPPGVATYIATRDFSHPLGGSLTQFRARVPITDSMIVDELLKAGAPIELLPAGTKSTKCPFCHQSFAVEEGTTH